MARTGSVCGTASVYTRDSTAGVYVSSWAKDDRRFRTFGWSGIPTFRSTGEAGAGPWSPARTPAGMRRSTMTTISASTPRCPRMVPQRARILVPLLKERGTRGAAQRLLRGGSPFLERELVADLRPPSLPALHELFHLLPEVRRDLRVHVC